MGGGGRCSTCTAGAGGGGDGGISTWGDGSRAAGGGNTTSATAAGATLASAAAGVDTGVDAVIAGAAAYSAAAGASTGGFGDGCDGTGGFGDGVREGGGSKASLLADGAGDSAAWGVRTTAVVDTAAPRATAAVAAVVALRGAIGARATSPGIGVLPWRTAGAGAAPSMTLVNGLGTIAAALLVAGSSSTGTTTCLPPAAACARVVVGGGGDGSVGTAVSGATHGATIATGEAAGGAWADPRRTTPPGASAAASVAAMACASGFIVMPLLPLPLPLRRRTTSGASGVATRCSVGRATAGRLDGNTVLARRCITGARLARRSVAPAEAPDSGVNRGWERRRTAASPLSAAIATLASAGGDGCVASASTPSVARSNSTRSPASCNTPAAAAAAAAAPSPPLSLDATLEWRRARGAMPTATRAVDRVRAGRPPPGGRAAAKLRSNAT